MLSPLYTRGDKSTKTPFLNQNIVKEQVPLRHKIDLIIILLLLSL